MAGPKLPNLKDLIAAGIDPKTGLPLKFTSSDLDCSLKDDIRKQIRLVDEQDAVNRYEWYNLPDGLNGQLLERMLYYKGQLAFFYMEANDKFYCLPYSLNGNQDVYGRFMSISPLIFNGSYTKNKKEKDVEFIPGMVKKVYYDISEDPTWDTYIDGAVILKDYTPQLDETIISRQIIQDPLLDHMAEVLPLARTSLFNNSGTRGMRVNDETQAESVRDADRIIKQAALSGSSLVPIVASLEFQDLGSNTPLRSEEYLLYLQALDNYRLSLYGLGNGGLFQKKSHMLESEQQMNQSTNTFVLKDGLKHRQEFCNLINRIWGLGVWCEIAPEVNIEAMNNPDEQEINNEVYDNDTEEVATNE